MKKTATIIISLILLFVGTLTVLAASSAPTSVNRVGGNHIEPLVRTDYIKAVNFVASTTNQNIFPGDIVESMGIFRNRFGACITDSYSATCNPGDANFQVEGETTLGIINANDMGNNKLNVNGNVAIGSSYYSQSVSDFNGLSVQGRTNIGSLDGDSLSKLYVNGTTTIKLSTPSFGTTHQISFDNGGAFTGANLSYPEINLMATEGFGKGYLNFGTYGEALIPTIQWRGEDTGNFTGAHIFSAQQSDAGDPDNVLQDILWVGNTGSLGNCIQDFAAVGVLTDDPCTALDVNGDITDRAVPSAAYLGTDSSGVLIAKTAPVSSAFPFTTGTQYGQTSNSTSTLIHFGASPISLTASSTAVINNLRLTNPLTIVNGGNATSTTGIVPLTARLVGANVGINMISPVGGGNSPGGYGSTTPAFEGQFASTYSGAGGTTLMAAARTNRYNFAVSGISVAPTVGASYFNNCSGSVLSTILTGSSPNIQGTMQMTQNCAPFGLTGTLTKSGGTGDSSISYSNYTVEQDYANTMGFPGGVYEFGDKDIPTLNGDFGTMALNLNFSPANWHAGGDSGLHFVEASDNIKQSGASNIFDVMQCTFGTYPCTDIDSVGNGIVSLPANRVASLVPGWMGIVQNYHSGDNKGFWIGSVGAGGGVSDPVSGNYGNMFVDSVNQRVLFPKMTARTYQPGDTNYNFTVSGVTNAPAVSDIYTNNSCRFEILSTTIVAGSGTVNATGNCFPTSGNLVQDQTAGNAKTGDGTVAFSAVATSTTFNNGIIMDNLNGRLLIGTSTGLTAFDVLGDITDESQKNCSSLSTNNNGKISCQSGVATSTGSYRNQTATIPSVNTYTPTASSTYQVSVSASVRTISAGTLTVTCTYTNVDGTASTATFFPMGLTTAGLSSTGSPAFTPLIITPMKNNPVTVVATFTGVSVSYDVDASILPIGTTVN